MTALDVASVNEHPDVFATLQLMSPLTTDYTDNVRSYYKFQLFIPRAQNQSGLCQNGKLHKY